MSRILRSFSRSPRFRSRRSWCRHLRTRGRRIRSINPRSPRRASIFRTVREQARVDIAETARRIDEGLTEVYKDFWHGEVFESGEEFLRFQGQFGQSKGGNEKSGENRYNGASPRISKILGLIRCIEEKGKKASQADLHFLGSLREKAVQLGCSC